MQEGKEGEPRQRIDALAEFDAGETEMSWCRKLLAAILAHAAAPAKEDLCADLPWCFEQHQGEGLFNMFPWGDRHDG